MKSSRGLATALSLLISSGAAAGARAAESGSDSQNQQRIANSINEQLKRFGCKSQPASRVKPEEIVSQLNECETSSWLTESQRHTLRTLKTEFLKTSATLTKTGLTVDSGVGAILESLQRQINELKASVATIKKEKQESDRQYQAKEEEFSKTISNLRTQIATLEQKSGTSQIASTSAGAAPQPGQAVATQGAEKVKQDTSPPKFKPTLWISGSANLVIGGVTGQSTSLSSTFWNGRVQVANRGFSNAAVELSPNNVTGASNRAGGTAFAYYRSGQSNLFFPPNGLQAVNPAVASNYAIASSWTGGKVVFTSLNRGGSLVITDPSDPNYNPTSPRTLDKSGYELAVNLKGQPVVPNSGLGGLVNPSKNYEPVDAASFNLKNLGSDITFSNIPLGAKDVQNLINLGNASRALKLGPTADQTRSYTVAASETVSTIAYQNNTSAARLLELNPQLPPATDANSVLTQGTLLNVPTVGCVVLCQGLNTVANGGLVQNRAFYDDLLNLAVAEYGSLSTAQQNNPSILAAARGFVRELVRTSPGDTPEVEDFNFQRSYTFNNDVKVHFRASLTGADLMNASIRYRNFVPYGERGRFPALNLAYGFGTINDSYVSFDRLWWKIPVAKDTSVFVGTRYKDYDFLPVQYGTFYPVEQQNYFFASGAGLADYVGAGAGITIRNLVKNVFGGSISFGGGYMANPFDAINPVSNSVEQKGIVGRDTRFRAPFQLGYVSNDGNVMASLNYIYSRGDTLNAFVGTNLSANPFFYDVDNVNQLGATFAWQFTDNASINFVYNHFTYTARENVNVFGVPMTQAGDQAMAQSWMAALIVDDLFVDSSKLGIAVGQVPSIYSNQSAWGTDTPPLAFEAWYNYPFSDRVFIQPAFFLVTNHDGFSNGGTDWGSTFRVYLNF